MTKEQLEVIDFSLMADAGKQASEAFAKMAKAVAVASGITRKIVMGIRGDYLFVDEGDALQD